MVTPCALSRHLIVTILFVAALLTAILAALQFSALELQDTQAMLDRLPLVLRYEAMRVFPPALLMLAVVHWRFLAPLRRLLRCTEQNDPAPLPEARKDTVGQLAGAFGDLQRRLHQTREELEHHRSWCQLLFDDAPEAILLLDPTSELVLDANAAACRLLVHPRESLAGLPLTQLCPDNLSALQGFMRRVRRDRSGWTTELHCRNAVGEVVELEIKAAVVERTGAEVMLTTLRPLTNQAVAQAKVDALAYHDALTGLPNRVLLRDRLDMALARCHRSPGQRGAVLMLDVDNFKTINDPLGHSAGDRLLQELAGRILKALHPDDTLARLGGDEFVVLPQQMDTETAPVLEHALALVDQVRAILDRPFVIDEHEIHITVSVGVAVYPDDGNSVDELLRRTDSAMYQAKAAGRNKTHFYSPELEEGVARRLTMGTALRRALAEEEFLLHFQPKFALPGLRLVGCEALVRWERPGHGLVPPLEFLPYLEEIGLMTELGFWVLDRACQQWREGRTEGRLDANFRMAVNVSAGQFASSAFVQMVLSILQENAMPGCNLELEITEQALVNDLANAAAKITALQAHGVSFAIDDFGTGYSSLAYLQQLPVDCLKIDRGFVTLIGQTDRSAGLVDVIIGIARKLNLRVVAEGVEHERQLAYLNQHGCDIGQGYLFGRPMPWQQLLDEAGDVTGSRDRDGFAG